MSWCFQCGVEGRPVAAVGVDEDGEPACAGHRVKELGAGLNAAAVHSDTSENRDTAVPAPIQDSAAAPSPVQTSAKEKEMRLCACGCGEPTKSNRSRFLRGHNPDAKNYRGPSAIEVHPAQQVRINNGVITEVGRLITIQLGESQVQKLLALLLQRLA